MEVADILETCPEDRRDRYKKMVVRAEGSPGSKKAAIRLKCLECCNWSESEVAKCHIKSCALWEFRAPSTGRKNRHE